MQRNSRNNLNNNSKKCYALHILFSSITNKECNHPNRNFPLGQERERVENNGGVSFPVKETKKGWGGAKNLGLFLKFKKNLAYIFADIIRKKLTHSDTKYLDMQAHLSGFPLVNSKKFQVLLKEFSSYRQKIFQGTYWLNSLTI